MTSHMTTAPVQTPAIQLEEIRNLVKNDLPALETRPAPASLGELAGLWSWLASVQNKSRPSMQHPRMALFLAAHGIAPETQADLSKLIPAYRMTQHPVSALALAANADLQIYEMDLTVPSVNYQTGDAMTVEQVLQTLAYGMMAVKPGIDLVTIALPNPAAALAADEIRKRLKQGADPLDALTTAGGMDIAAAVGAVIASRLARIPVILDGSAAEVAGEILAAFQPDAASHTRKASDITRAATHLPLGGDGGYAIGILKSLCAVV